MNRIEIYHEDEIKFTVRDYVPIPFYISQEDALKTDITDAYFDGYPQIIEKAQIPNYRGFGRYRVKVEKDIEIPLDNGRSIVLDVYRPDAEGRFPTLLSWGMWGKDAQEAVFWLRDKPQAYFDTPFWDGALEAGDIPYLVSHGFVHVIPDPPGIGKAKGVVRSLLDLHRPEDIITVIKWIAKQPWSNGKVGMIGPSSYAFSQAMVGQNPPEELKALFPIAFWWVGDYDFTGMRDAMIFGIVHGMHGNDSTHPLSKINYGKPYALDMPKDELDRLLEEMLNDPDIKYNSKFYSLLRYPYKDPILFDLMVGWFRPSRPPVGNLERIEIPIYIGAVLPGGGHRIYWVAYEAWEKVRSKAKKMIILPPGELRRPVVDYHDEYLRWFKYWLNGENTHIMDEPPIKLFVLGVNKWKFEKEWPPARVKWINLYPSEGGKLVETPPSFGSESFTQPSALYDSRVYCLTYTTEPLRESIELIGPVAVHLEASINETDANLIVNLVDINPDGTKKLITEGWLRASFYKLDEEKSRDYRPVHKRERELITPGKRYHFAIPMIPTAAVIFKGHRLQLIIRGQEDMLSYKARYGVYFLPQMRTVTYTIYFGSNTRVVLPLTGTEKDVERRIANGENLKKSWVGQL